MTKKTTSSGPALSRPTYCVLNHKEVTPFDFHFESSEEVAMGKQVQVAFLGKDLGFLERISKRCLEEGLIEPYYFTKVEDMIHWSIESPPDLFSISADFPHKNITKFPETFRKVFGKSTIVFTEQRFRRGPKLLFFQSRYKIEGVGSSYKFWVQFINFQKNEERRALNQKKNPHLKTSSQTEELEKSEDSLYVTGENEFLNMGSGISKEGKKLKTKVKQVLEKVLSQYLEENSFHSSIIEKDFVGVKQVNIFSFRFEDMKGFLIVADDLKNRDLNVFENIQSYICKKLNNQGYDVSLERSLSWNIHKLKNYLKTVSSVCDLNVFGSRKDESISFSFLSSSSFDQPPHYEDTEGMMKVDIEKIPTDTALDFDAFIYMPSNKKLLSYVKKGGLLSSEQVDRLSESILRGEFYIEKENEANLVKLFLERQMNKPVNKF